MASLSVGPDPHLDFLGDLPRGLVRGASAVTLVSALRGDGRGTPLFPVLFSHV